MRTQRAGIGICTELCGVLPKREDGSTGAYTSVGLAEALFDSLDEVLLT